MKKLIFLAGGLNPPISTAQLYTIITLCVCVLMVIASFYVVRDHLKRQPKNYKGNKKIKSWLYAIDDPFDLRWFSPANPISKEKLKGNDYWGGDVRTEKTPIDSWEKDLDDKYNLSKTLNVS